MTKAPLMVGNLGCRSLLLYVRQHYKKHPLDLVEVFEVLQGEQT